MLNSLGLFVTLQDSCNLDCSFCQFPLRKEFRGGKKLDYDKKIDNCSLDIPIGAVSFCGSGEPLLYDRIVEIVTETKRYIPFVSLVTNGVLLNQELSEKLIMTDIDHIVVSITGITNAVYSTFQGSGDGVRNSEKQLKTVKINVNNLVKIRNRKHKNTQIGISYLLSDESKNEYFDAVNYWDSVGVNYVDTRMLQCGFSYKVEEYDEYVKNNSKWWLDRNCCTCFGKVMNVFTDGRISVCNNVESEQIVGNIYEESISEIINSKKFLDLYKCVTENYLNMPDYCKTCDMLRARPILT